MDKILKIMTVGIMFVLTLSVIGCAPTTETKVDEPSNESSELNANDKEEPAMNEEQVTGTVTSISEAEIMIDAVENTDNYLKGPVRVNMDNLDVEILNTLKVGDTVTVTWSGIVGMSEPPFISAQSIEIQ